MTRDSRPRGCAAGLTDRLGERGTRDRVIAAGLDVAGVLHAQIVLVGAEVRHPVVVGVLAEHRPGRRLRLMQRVVPVLDPDVSAEQPVVGVGDVAGGVDVRVGGTQLRVDDDAVAGLQAGHLGSWLLGVIPTPTMIASAWTRLPSASRAPPARQPDPVISATWTPKRRS